MATVPSNAQFRADTTGVTVEQLGSEQTNARAAFFTMADIAESAGPSTNNTVYGLDAFRSNTSGAGNVAIGWESLRNLQSGSENVAVGVAAMGEYENISSGNTAVGHIALLGANAIAAAPTGNFNTSMGYAASYSTDTGSNNTAIGYKANVSIYQGDNNVAVGYQAMNGVWQTSGSENVALGKESLFSVSSGSGNVAVGLNSGRNISSGSNNIFVGKSADALGGITGSIVIGSEAQASADNQLVIGSGSYPVGTFNAYTGSAFETWEIIVNGNPVKLMVAP